MQNLPKHIALIMDGNGRWAKQRGLPRTAGHKMGAKRIRDIVKVCGDIGVASLSIYAFSTENWRRPDQEVSFLFRLILRNLEREIAALHRENVRLRFIGNLAALPEKLQASCHAAMTLTQANTGLKLNCAINYGGRWELVEAAKRFATKVQAGQQQAHELTESQFASYLTTAPDNDIDLLIRTSGECRISNFLLWQLSYAEIYITDKHFPEFTKEAFLAALEHYAQRDRRLGKTQEQLPTTLKE